MRAAVVYTAGRLALFVLVAVLLWSGAGALDITFNGLPLLLAALLLSSIASLFLLRGQRDRLAVALAERRDARATRLAVRRARLEGDPPTADR